MRHFALALALVFALACSGEGDDSQTAAVGETITMPSGVQVTHLVIGTGPNPKATDRVSVHYHGTFPDGTVFDSSVERDEPATFPLNKVIDCWTEGVQLMKVGGKANLVCPPATAYGERGTPRIPPNSTLQFEVQLLAIP
jgi:FKBP-type peptidyl-prolyl cis-trans isomerase FkpA